MTARKTVKAPVVLSDDVLKVMDLAVRAAREEGYCDYFSKMCEGIFGVPKSEIRDNEGFDCEGYGKDGFDEHGFDVQGYDKEGYNGAGRNKNGYDKEGYDRSGYNSQGIDKNGKDKYRYDSNGYDKDGYSATNYRRNANRDWYTRQASRPDIDFAFDENGNPRPSKKTPVRKAAVRKVSTNTANFTF